MRKLNVILIVIMLFVTLAPTAMAMLYQPEIRLSGTVYNGDNTVVAGTTVTITSSSRTYSCVTDINGRYEKTWSSDASYYTISVPAIDDNFGWSKYLYLRPGSPTIDIHLYTSIIYLRDHNSNPVSGVPVDILIGGSKEYSGYTESDGSFRKIGSEFIGDEVEIHPTYNGNKLTLKYVGERTPIKITKRSTFTFHVSKKVNLIVCMDEEFRDRFDGYFFWPQDPKEDARDIMNVVIDKMWEWWNIKATIYQYENWHSDVTDGGCLDDLISTYTTYAGRNNYLYVGLVADPQNDIGGTTQRPTDNPKNYLTASIENERYETDVEEKMKCSKIVLHEMIHFFAQRGNDDHCKDHSDWDECIFHKYLPITNAGTESAPRICVNARFWVLRAQYQDKVFYPAL